MKKMLILVAIALIAAPAFAGGTLATKEIPVMMVIDKAVTLTVNPASILLSILDPNVAVGDSVYRGYTGVTMTHNFPVKVEAAIVPFGPSLGSLAMYKVALAKGAVNLPQTVVEWTAALAVDFENFNTPAPAPIGEMFYVGAAVLKVDLTYAPSSPTAIQVATVGLTVSDNL
jgi:hypothetical protein